MLSLFAVPLFLTVVGVPVTFLVSPDTHFTQCGGAFDTDKNVRGIAEMNSLEGQPFPKASGVVGRIRGVVVPGDLVDDGCSPTSTAIDPGCAEQLGNYTKYFGVHPGEGLVKYPTFDGIGNHDGGNSTDPKYGLVRQEVISRNKRRDQAKVGISNYSLAPNALHYSWDWDGLHLAMLNVYPGTEGDCAAGVGVPGNGCTGAPFGWHSPEHSLDFLVADLAKLDKATPTVIFMHYGLKGFGSPGTVPWAGYSPDFWWSAREATAFAKAIAPYNVVAIVHGHTHACVFYKWDLTTVTGKVYPVFNAPALQKGGPKDPASTPSQFLAFEIDPAAKSLRVFQRVGSSWGSVMYEGSFAGGSKLVAGRTEPAVVGDTVVIAEEPPVLHRSVVV